MLALWELTTKSEIRRRMWPGTRVSDGTRYVRVKFGERIRSLPYSTKFITAQGVLHTGQVRVCRLCIMPGHVVKECPELACRKCSRQGHFSRDCWKYCTGCHKEKEDCECQINTNQQESEQEAEDGGEQRKGSHFVVDKELHGIGGVEGRHLVVDVETAPGCSHKIVEGGVVGLEKEGGNEGLGKGGVAGGKEVEDGKVTGQQDGGKRNNNDSEDDGMEVLEDDEGEDVPGRRGDEGEDSLSEVEEQWTRSPRMQEKIKRPWRNADFQNRRRR